MKLKFVWRYGKYDLWTAENITVVQTSLSYRRFQPATRTPPQPATPKLPTHIETRTYNQCGDAIEKSEAPDDGYINIRNMLNIEEVK